MHIVTAGAAALALLMIVAGAKAAPIGPGASTTNGTIGFSSPEIDALIEELELLNFEAFKDDVLLGVSNPDVAAERQARAAEIRQEIADLEKTEGVIQAKLATQNFVHAAAAQEQLAAKIILGFFGGVDPFVAFSADVENFADVEQTFDFGGFLPIGPVGAPLSGQSRLEIELIDANADGAASIAPALGSGGFLTDFQGDDGGVLAIFPSFPVGGPIDGPTDGPVVFDTGVGPAPFGEPGNPIDTLFFKVAFTLSPGDRARFGVFFGAFDDESFEFPAELAIDVAAFVGDVDLDAPPAVPLPPSAVLLLGALACLGAGRFRQSVRRSAEDRR